MVKKKKKRLKAKQLCERIISSFVCSFRLFFILSEPVVPPLITTALTHSWVWPLEILKWAKNVQLRHALQVCSRGPLPSMYPESQQHSTVLLASPLSPDLFCFRAGGPHRSFPLRASLSQHGCGLQSPCRSPDGQIKHAGSPAEGTAGPLAAPTAFPSGVLGVRLFLCSFAQMMLLAVLPISFSLCGFFSSQVKISVPMPACAAKHLAFTHQWLLSCFIGPVVNGSACETPLTLWLCVKPPLIAS